MVVKKVRKVYRIEERISKPIIIRFRKKDGGFVEFKGTKIIKKPKRIVFRKVKKVYYKPFSKEESDE